MRNIEVWSDYDGAGRWCLKIQKTKGKLTLEDIKEACIDYEEDFYLLVICAIDRENDYYDVDDLKGDFVTLYRADDFFEWRAKN